MKGDRVLITGTNKELGVINGDLGEVLHSSTEKFIISIKAQGASIKDVYVFHDKFSGIRNSYVSLSRHIDELKLYTNRESTADINILEKQLSRDFAVWNI